MATSLPTLTPLASAIAQSEGYGVPGAIPTVANNPGNLELGDVGYGTANAAGGNQITIFGSLADGAAALENQLNKIFNGTSSNYTPDMSLSQFGQIYSGGNPAYGNQLASTLGVSPSTPLSQVQSQASASSASGTPSTSSWLTNPFGNLLGLTSSNPASAFTLSRAIILILGIILFGAGLFAFKQTQTVIQTATRTAGNVGKIATL